MTKTTNIEKIFILIIATFAILFFNTSTTLASEMQFDSLGYTQEELAAIYAQQQQEAAQQAVPAQPAPQQVVPEQPAPQQVAPSQVTTNSVMPTVANMDNPKNANRYGQVAGTDQWNDMIYSHCMARGIDPIFLKAIMTVESGGNVAAKNGSYWGLYQVGKSFGYDKTLMLSDPDYQTEAAIDVIMSKIMVAYSLDCKANVYYIAKFYNGGEAYAKEVSRIYEDLTGVEGSSKTNLVKIF